MYITTQKYAHFTSLLSSRNHSTMLISVYYKNCENTCLVAARHQISLSTGMLLVSFPAPLLPISWLCSLSMSCDYIYSTTHVIILNYVLPTAKYQRLVLSHTRCQSLGIK